LLWGTDSRDRGFAVAKRSDLGHLGSHGNKKDFTEEEGFVIVDTEVFKGSRLIKAIPLKCTEKTMAEKKAWGSAVCHG